MKLRVVSAIILSMAVIIIGVALGSVSIDAGDILGVIRHRVFKAPLPEGISASDASIVWSLRLPRALLAFVAGGALSVSGAVMQSILRNPLASSYTLGISSGASLGACLVILYGLSIPLAQTFTLPIVGFAFGLATIVLALSFAGRVDGQMGNHTVILTGMVISLFVNAVTMLLSALEREQLQRLIFWQMGSFAMKDWQPLIVLAPLTVFGVLFILRYHGELDIMSFGEEQAQAVGVPLKRVKWTLLIAAAALTGSAISFIGVVGFVDLIVPHIVRRLFGTPHRLVIPMSAVVGGAFMVLCDLAARTVAAPTELPVGAVTAIIGAPFFAFIYFGKRKSR